MGYADELTAAGALEAKHYPAFVVFPEASHNEKRASGQLSTLHFNGFEMVRISGLRRIRSPG
jgi:hypothetical protein